MGLRFTKMHGLGNDFAVVDCRRRALHLDAAAIRRFGDRHFGVGFDQLLTIEPARADGCAFAYGIWNRDGEPVGQCGNGLRCVARWLAREGALGPGLTRLQSPSGPVAVELLASDRVRAEMGEPRFEPERIPLRAAGLAESYRIAHALGSTELGAVSLGNPHAVVEVEDLATAPVAVLGPQLARAPAFPQGCNVGFVEFVSASRLRLRVWERGTGETLACGSGACAAMAVLRKRGRVAAQVEVELPGGCLAIDWEGPGQPLWMTGPATFVFEGEWLDPQPERAPAA